MVAVEVCLCSDDLTRLASNVSTAFQAGAARIELCSAMNNDGLTPDMKAVAIARKNFGQRSGLMVMIRPRTGNFIYNSDEANLMQLQIKQAAYQGADGVVLGAVNHDGSLLDINLLTRLINVSKQLGLQVGIHRAFDVIDDSLFALTQLIELGVDRVLTSGTSWESKSGAMSGLSKLSELVRFADSRIEIVIAGGVSPLNAQAILDKVSIYSNALSLHTYSGVLNNNKVEPSMVESLVNIRTENECKQ